MKIKHISQKHNECGPCSFAMALGISLKKSKNILKKAGWNKKKGLTRKEIMTALDWLEYDCRYSDGQFMKSLKKTKRPVILMVESKNEKHGYHILVVYKGNIFDPQEGNKKVKTYTKDSLKHVLKKAMYVIEFKKRNHHAQV